MDTDTIDAAFKNLWETIDRINEEKRRAERNKLIKTILFAGAAFGFLKYSEHSIAKYENAHPKK